MITIHACETEEDIKALAKVANVIWHEYFINIISLEQIEYMIEKFQSYTALQKAIKEEGYAYYLAYDQNELIGYCGIRVDDNRLFLSKLYLLKEQRGKGISSILFNQAYTYAMKHKLQAIYLTCNKYNTNSLDIYKHKGFHIIDAVQSDIGHNFIMDDYILQLDLSNG